MPDKPIRLTEKDILALHDACQSCHARTFADWKASRHATTYAGIFLDPVHNKAEQLAPDCLRCHGMFYEGHIEDLVGPLDVSRAVDAERRWRRRRSAAIPCLACHQIHTPAAESGPAQLYVRREDRHIFLATSCPPRPSGKAIARSRYRPTHGKGFVCSAMPPTPFASLAASDDRTPAGVHEGLSCFDCHQSHSLSAKVSCAACHPGSSHCGIDVEKMDTTFNSPQSKHNIHTVACGDCHNGRRPGRTSPK